MAQYLSPSDLVAQSTKYEVLACSCRRTRDSHASLGVWLVASLDPPLIGINYIKLLYKSGFVIIDYKIIYINSWVREAQRERHPVHMLLRTHD